LRFLLVPRRNDKKKESVIGKEFEERKLLKQSLLLMIFRFEIQKGTVLWLIKAGGCIFCTIPFSDKERFPSPLLKNFELGNSKS